MIKEILRNLLANEDTLDIFYNSSLIGAVAFYNEMEDVEKWNIMFYNHINDKAYMVEVNKDLTYTISDSELADSTFKEIFFDPLTEFMDDEDALSVCFAYYMENFAKKEIKTMFLSLNTKSKTWDLFLVTSTLSLIKISIDIFNGELKESGEVNTAYVFTDTPNT